MKHPKIRKLQNNPNHFVISTVQGEYFQSYETVVARITPKGVVYIDEGQADGRSQTTSKYLAIFLGIPYMLVTDRIESGQFKRANLN